MRVQSSTTKKSHIGEIDDLVSITISLKPICQLYTLAERTRNNARARM